MNDAPRTCRILQNYLHLKAYLYVHELYICLSCVVIQFFFHHHLYGLFPVTGSTFLPFQAGYSYNLFFLLCIMICYFSGCSQSSVRTPPVDFGCRNPIVSPSAPARPSLSISLTPFDSTSFRDSLMSLVAYAM